jgi:hypothetical protein
MTTKILLINILILYCNIVFGQFKSTILQIDSNKYQLIVKFRNNNDSQNLIKRLPYKVFKIRQADIDNDGIDDIILGVFKSTVFDSTLKNRINIWNVDSNLISPKWLSSFLPHPLYDFEISNSNNETLVRTIEYEQNKLFLVAEYKWHSFGLKFIKYIVRNISLNEAQTILNNQL